jgi:hypothetical protein
MLPASVNGEGARSVSGEGTVGRAGHSATIAGERAWSMIGTIPIKKPHCNAPSKAKSTPWLQTPANLKRQNNGTTKNKGSGSSDDRAKHNRAPQ